MTANAGIGRPTRNKSEGISMSAVKQADLSTLMPHLPGWHRMPFLPVLVSLANSVEESGRPAAVDRLMEETLVSTPWRSHHEELRVRQALVGFSWSDEDIAKATEEAESQGKSGRQTYGSALRVGLGGGDATPATLHILNVVAQAIRPIL
jgi:hypothetical protein